MRYEQIRDPALPWGYWHRLQPGPSYIDEDGRPWTDLRASLWEGRLGMSGYERHLRDEQLEIVLAALAAHDRKRRHPTEHANDVYQGPAFYRFHSFWLQSLGFIAGGLRGNPFDCETTPEGLAVISMLLTTRSPELFGVPIGREAVRIMAAAPQGPEARDPERLDVFEKGAAARLTHSFVRGTIGGMLTIALHYKDVAGLMPVVRTIWSMAFPDEHSRDAIYRFLVERVDRWDHWGRLAFRSGGPALTQELLALVAINLDGAPQPGRPRQRTADVIALPDRREPQG